MIDAQTQQELYELRQQVDYYKKSFEHAKKKLEEEPDTVRIAIQYIKYGLVILGIIILGIWGIVALSSLYSVWSAAQAGKAQLAQADYNRKIMVVEAQAKTKAATFTAKADIIRAQGIAKANKIIGQSLNHNESYLEWKFIDELPQQHNQVIYLPTHTFLPITESNRFKLKNK